MARSKAAKAEDRPTPRDAERPDPNARLEERALRKPDDTTKPPRKQRPRLRLVKPPPPAPDGFALWRGQQRAFRERSNDPNWRKRDAAERKIGEAAHNLLPPERHAALALLRIQSAQRQALGLLRVSLGDEPPPPPEPPPPSPPKRKRGAPAKLTAAEIATGIEIVRRENAKHRRRYANRTLKQAAALKALRRELKRDGEPIEASRSTLLRWIVRPALRGK
jgi:hypothetical protein